MQDDEIVGHLAGIDLFHYLVPFEIKKMVSNSTRQSWTDGQEIVTEDGDQTGFFLILDGNTRVLRHGEQVDTIGKGGYFGEISLIDGGSRTATIVADGDVETMAIGPGAFLTLLRAYPDFAHEITLVLCRRVRSLQQIHPHTPASA